MFERLTDLFYALAPLWEMSLTAAYVAVVVLVLRLLLKKSAPRQVVCLMWLLVFARLLLPVSVESAVSLVPSALTQAPVLQEQAPLPDHTASTPAPGNAPGGAPAPTVTADPGTAATQAPVLSTAPPVIAPAPTAAPVLTPSVTSPTQTFPWQGWAALLWVIGAAAMTLYGVGSYLALRRRVRLAVRTEDGAWECPGLPSPFILGLLRPRIYLPCGLSGQARSFILCHERAHLSRLDHLVKPLCWLALTVHWFNPMAWAAFLLLSRDMEVACDQKVLRTLGGQVKADYSATLLALATGGKFPAPCPVAFGEGNAKTRIKSVLAFKKPALWVSITAAAVAAVAAVCLLTDPAGPPDPLADGYTAQPEYPGLYFLEEPSATVGTKITAYRLVEGELVLVGGYDEHLANNFFGLIGPDGQEERLFCNPDEIRALFGELLAHDCLSADPTWTPPENIGFTLLDRESEGDLALYLGASGTLYLRKGALYGPVADPVDHTQPEDYTLYTGGEAPAEDEAKLLTYFRSTGETVVLPLHLSEEGVWVAASQFSGTAQLFPGANAQDLPRQLVTADTLPTDPEEYYLIGALPEQDVWLYARGLGQDSLLVWGNFNWLLPGKVHYTDLSLPELFLLGEDALAISSCISSGQNTGVYELTVYQPVEAQVGSSYYTLLQDYVYDWQAEPLLQDFNANNSLTYHKADNSLTLAWKGVAYETGPMTGGYAQAVEAPDGAQAKALASGQHTRFVFLQNGTIQVSVWSCFAPGSSDIPDEYGNSIGSVGFDPTWTVRFTGSGFEIVEGSFHFPGATPFRLHEPTIYTLADWVSRELAAHLVLARQAVPEDCLGVLTEEQAELVRLYNRQTAQVKSLSTSHAIALVNDLMGVAPDLHSFYHQPEEYYEYISQLSALLLNRNFTANPRSYPLLTPLLDLHPDSTQRVAQAVSALAADLAGWNTNLTYEGYLDMAERTLTALGGLGTSSNLLLGPEAAAAKVLLRRTVGEDILSLVDSRTADLIRQYNAQTQALKEAYADNIKGMLDYLHTNEDDSVCDYSQSTFHTRFTDRLSALVLYRNYTQLSCTDPTVSIIATFEGGGSAGLWAGMYQQANYVGEDLAGQLADYLDLVDTVLQRLSSS